MKKMMILSVIIVSCFIFAKAVDVFAEDAQSDTVCISEATGKVIENAKPPCEAGSFEAVALKNPLGENKTDVPVIIGGIINGALGIMGALVLLMFVWGANGYIMAAGNAEKIKSSTKTILWAAIGAVVVLASYIFLRGIFAGLGAGVV